MDVIIVSTATPLQRDYWQRRLNHLRGVIIPQNAILSVVVENWQGSAGNGLGTLYAYQQAHSQIKQQYHIDLYHLQNEGASVAIYHSVGRGQRLYPLTASEGYNKCAVKIPSTLLTHKTGSPTIAILEAVIYQTLQFAPYRKGRLSVFWGDQIFIPSDSLTTTDAAVDIFFKGSSMPSAQIWEREGWNRYGFIALGSNSEVQLLEKCDYNIVDQLAQSRSISTLGRTGRSLGSFSLSAAMTSALMDEFKEELQHKQAFMDADPSLWMPLSLNEASYSELMNRKGAQKMTRHYQRMQDFKRQFLHRHPTVPFFQGSDIGHRSYWWDYGSMEAYFHCLTMIARPSKESAAMRNFFNLDSISESHPDALQIDSDSLLLNCKISHGQISSSVLVGVSAESIDAENCIIVGSHLSRFKGKNSLIYNVREDAVLSPRPGTVRADIQVHNNPEQIKIYADLGQDAKNFWNSRLHHNSYSYAELEALNDSAQLNFEN